LARRRGQRQALARIGAPLAFLAAFTILALLIHSALSDSKTTTTTARTVTNSHRIRPVHIPPDNNTATVPTTTKKPAGPPKRYYIVVAGDSFGSIASRYGTTIERIAALNPGADSSSLTIGERIRVR
jgi:LysM repeat protein